jgi:hypothetical protein
MGPKQQLFTNNSEGKFLVALVAEEATVVTFENSEDIISGFAPLSVNDYQVGTLTHPSVPGVYEIVHLTFDGSNTVMLRAKESTPARDWPVGTKLGARVTAGMLQGFLGNMSAQGVDVRPPKDEKSISLGVRDLGHVPSGKGFAVLANSRWIENAWLIAGYPVLQLRGEGYSGHAIGDAATAAEAIFTSGSVELGTVPAWAAATDYRQGAVVQPSTSTGFQFRLDIPYPFTDHITSGAEEPPLLGQANSFVSGENPPSGRDGGPVIDPREPAGQSGSAGGYWIPQNLGTGVFLCIPTGYLRFYPTEIGFICDEHTASTAPVVSIGSAVLHDGETVAVEETPGLFANNLALSSITGPHMRHRITAMPDAGVLGFVIKLNSPAAGGSFHGRFYFKGMFAEVTDWMPPAP